VVRQLDARRAVTRFKLALQVEQRVEWIGKSGDHGRTFGQFAERLFVPCRQVNGPQVEVVMMATASQLARPATPLRRVLEAVGTVVSEMQTGQSIVEQPRSMQRAATTDIRPFLIRSTQKVIDHYRSVLANHHMTEAEQKVIQARIAEQERLLRDLVEEQKKRPMAERGCLEAA
jgi:hypothetical protein